MVRRCAVKNCPESDLTILSHRFPKTEKVASKWQKALNLHEISIDELQKKFVICTRHFSGSAYRNEISNSLNTTALPNLNDNFENERIYTTNPSLKKELSIPARCHRLPSENSKREIKVSASTVMKIRKLDSKLFKDREKSFVIKNGEVESFQEIIVPVEEEENPETFEVCELSEESRTEEEEVNEIFETESIVEERIQVETLVKDVEEPKTIEKCERETQTEAEEPAEVPQEVTTNESKDDKLIEILYPEYRDMGKIQLIELVTDKNRKIDALEEKIKKLELAMRNLL